MAKRQRGPSRPGQRRPTQRQSPPRPASSVTTRPPDSLTAADEARAAELEAELVAEERAAEAARNRGRDRGRAAADLQSRSRTRETGLLAARAAEEYTYVARDVRRIIAVGGSLLGILLAVWLVVEVLHVFAL